MRLLLVRHGETVDNVAGLYAGIRDSALTAHGVLQARRLASHLATRSALVGSVTNVFSSDLQRAANTAQAIIDAQGPPRQGPSSLAIPDRTQVRLVKVPDLRERNFGSAEGKRFGAPRADAESHEEMRARAARFVRNQLDPVLAREAGHRGVVVVVSHGILLNSLLRVLLMRHAPEELARMSATTRSEYLTSWSNTGYVEMAVRNLATPRPSSGGKAPSSPPRLELVLIASNVTTHLDGLKKTRGGIGSSQFDNRQRTMDAFLARSAKKRRIEGDSKGN
ncbi:histidine phosphatase superfamily [Schizothecium vesticola]|uniref:Histidine phosphatase superfamily n=1 Tax=Schizothecium vesticola TaxID=314040 RepID=A0AA40EJB8_9PEZI|nr:histidine phosphatase superfamily [Schizothecium vesticola]